MSKTRFCMLRKTKQTDEFIARFSVYKPGNSRLQEQWVLSCSQTKEILWEEYRSCLAFSAGLLPGGLLSYLDQGSWVRKWENPEMALKDLLSGAWLVSSTGFQEAGAVRSGWGAFLLLGFADSTLSLTWVAPSDLVLH